MISKERYLQVRDEVELFESRFSRMADQNHKVQSLFETYDALSIEQCLVIAIEGASPEEANYVFQELKKCMRENGILTRCDEKALRNGGSEGVDGDTLVYQRIAELMEVTRLPEEAFNYSIVQKSMGAGTPMTQEEIDEATGYGDFNFDNLPDSDETP